MTNFLWPDFSGNFTIPRPEKPVLYAFGWPNATCVTTSVETIDMDEIVSYDLFFGESCPDDSFNPSRKCSSNMTGLIQGGRCLHNEDDSCSLTDKVLNCTVGNHSQRCEFLKWLSKKKMVCVYFKVTTLNGSVCPSCFCRSYLDICEYTGFLSVLYLIYCISSNKHSVLISALPRRSIHLLGHDTKLVPPPPLPCWCKGSTSVRVTLPNNKISRVFAYLPNRSPS